MNERLLKMFHKWIHDLGYRSPEEKDGAILNLLIGAYQAGLDDGRRERTAGTGEG